ncbi:KIF1-binding protein like protein [Eufriesea mexicana]|uniref:KIF-binding protein n=1 Tax=Eufriesea mexicana TaxID=516756 RepID=A0A310SJT0_9HYME|nr:PREDICTED: KIF1-binding protein homolog [Eufriesea mexicana]OAD62954.1 KIF1-binding protein like protein [Eufriesea mexicana]
MESNCLQSTIANVQAKFEDVRQLLDDHEKLRTECEPYKIKYQAIEILQSLKTDLINVLTNMPEEEKEEVIIMLGVVHLKLGLLHTDTEELKAGEEQFMKCIKLLKNKELEPKVILSILSALNQLGIIWSRWNQPMKAKSFLDQAEKLYNDFMNTNNPCRYPINIVQNFGIEQVNDELNPKEIMEKIHTLTLYYLAQVYSSLKDHYQSAIYCHMTLRRQLGHNDIMQDLDYIDWALNAATLSQYFIENDGFPQAKHHLAAASYILQIYENMLKQKTEDNGEDEALAAEWENFKHRSADVARCWAKYGILLMSLSKQRLLQKNESKQDNNQIDNKDFSKLKIIDDLRFNILEKEIEAIANQITDKYLLDFADARLVFLNAQKWLEQAKTYYTLENHASDHILIVQSISQAYKYLSFFEENEARQAKMHKKRIDILENVIKELNPRYYESACRQIWVELGETYSDILDIKLDRLRSSDEKPTPQALTKINHLVKSSIKNFQAFLDSLQIHNSNSGPEQFSNELVQPALFSYFHLGRLYNKIITPDKTIQLENMQNSYNAYKFVIDYWKKYPNAADVMGVELNLCKELVNLLPMKINMLREGIINK